MATFEKVKPGSVRDPHSGITISHLPSVNEQEFNWMLYRIEQRNLRYDFRIVPHTIAPRVENIYIIKNTFHAPGTIYRPSSAKPLEIRLNEDHPEMKTNEIEQLEAYLVEGVNAVIQSVRLHTSKIITNVKFVENEAAVSALLARDSGQGLG